MGFKLGKERGIQVDNGEIKNKMRFNKDDVSIPGVPVIRKELKKVEEETKEAAKESTVSLPPLTEGDKTRIRILMNNQGITEEEAKIRLNLQGRS